MSTIPPLLILDGGTGRELARQGAPFRQPEWSALALLEGPQFVSQVHQAYLAAGADLITTNSYALVPFHLGESRFADQGARLAALAGQLARDAVTRWMAQRAAVGSTAGSRTASRPAPRVAGSLPPVCGSYRADLFDAAQMRCVLQVLVTALAPHVDLWLAETLSTTAEAQAVRDVLGNDPRPLWLSFTLQDGEDAATTPSLRSGESVAAAVQTALRLNATALLFNCSQPEVMAAAVCEAIRVLNEGGRALPVGVYANAFPPQPAEAEANAGLDPIRDDLTPAGYAAFAERWWALGASMVGGCCGIGPEHVAALRAALDARTPRVIAP